MRGNLLRWIVLMAKISSCSCCEISVFSAGVCEYESRSSPVVLSYERYQLKLDFCLLSCTCWIKAIKVKEQIWCYVMLCPSVFYPVCCYMAAGIALRAAVWFLCTLTLMEGDCSICKGRLQMGRLPLSLAPSLPGLLTSAVMTPDIRCTLSALSLWTYTQNRLLWFSVCLCLFLPFNWKILHSLIQYAYAKIFFNYSLIRLIIAGINCRETQLAVLREKAF